MAISARRLAVNLVLVAGLLFCVVGAVRRIQALGRPLIALSDVPSGGGIGSMSADPLAGLVPLVLAAMTTFVLLSRAPTLRPRPGWALGYAAVAGP